ncbi:MAG: CC/Se motif family (seleno)protein [Bacillota bacterium]
MRITIPRVWVGAPEDTEKYDRYEVEGIEIYLYKGASVKNALRLVLANYIIYKEISVEGIDIM